jgi:hypothetical protein
MALKPEEAAKAACRLDVIIVCTSALRLHYWVKHE